MTQPNPSTAQARAVVDELSRHGVAFAMVSPGSRSSALAIALDSSSIEVHVVLDERSASFQGLGIAKASGVPVVCVATSGTAGANFFPAVIEADLSGVPLIVITADRPAELRDVGANQTIDQVGLFGHRVRWACDMGLASSQRDENVYWRTTVSQAMARARGFGGSPGPVHLNVSFREPTVPVRDDGRVVSDEYPFSIAGRDDGGPWQDHSLQPASGVNLAELDGKRCLVVVGEGVDQGSSVLAEAERLGWPVLATALSGLRGPGVVTSYHHLLVDGVPDRLRPEAVVTAGRLGPSDRLRALTGAGGPTIHFERWGRWTDPNRDATRMLEASLGASLAGVSSGAGATFRDEWLASDARMREALHDRIVSDATLTGPAISSALSGIDWGALVVASSMPVRDVDGFMTRRGPVFGNRGASGIDGFNSTAIGVSRVCERTLGVSGDLSFLHDLPGLMSGSDSGLVEVVVDNNGGGLFDLLPQANHAPGYERLFVTPHDRDIAAIANSLGLRATKVARIEEMADAVEIGLDSDESQVIVVPVERGADAKQRRGLDETARLSI